MSPAALVALLAFAAAVTADGHVQPRDGHVQPKGAHHKLASHGMVILSDGETVTVDSPNFPRRYPPNSNASTFVMGDDENLSLYMECEFIDIAKTKKCRRDYLQIYNDWDSLGKFCGTKMPRSFVTKNATITFHFMSDARKQSHGFSCNVTAFAPTECECGMEAFGSRIVGGEEAMPHQFPWLVAISSKGGDARPNCGASLYNNKFIITAAHCVKGVKSKKIEVILGMHNWQTEESAPMRMLIRKYYMHPDYSPRTLDNDIAIIEMKDPIPYSPRVMPVCMPSNVSDFVGSMGTVAGWGALSEGGSQPDVTNFVNVPIISNVSCNASYPDEITDNMICAGTDAGGVDSCQGDSGGPFTVVNSDGAHVLAGVVSWGAGCARPGSPGVYAKTARYLRWIESIAGRNCEKFPLPDFEYVSVNM